MDYPCRATRPAYAMEMSLALRSVSVFARDSQWAGESTTTSARTHMEEFCSVISHDADGVSAACALGIRENPRWRVAIASTRVACAPQIVEFKHCGPAARTRGV